MEKNYIGAEALLIDSFVLATKVFESGFQPDFIVGVWRGGTPVGIAIQECLDYVGIKTDHIAIRASSYSGIDQQSSTVQVDGLDYLVDNIHAESRVLLVDDVFDSGQSMQAIIREIKRMTQGNTPKDIRIACPWYKPTRNTSKLTPDYFVHETEDWLVFPHELKGLSLSEIQDHKPQVAHALKGLLEAGK